MRIFFLLAFAGALALGQGLEIQRLSPPAKVRPGDLTVQVWQITNKTPQAVIAKLALELPKGWEALNLPEALSLGPGEEDYLFLTLYIPRTAKSGVQTVRVFLRWDGEEAEAEATVEVEAVAALELLPPPSQSAQPGETLSFTLLVVNRGNALDRIGLEVRTAVGWKVRVLPAELPLAPGEKGEIRVTVEIPQDAAVGREVVLAVARSGMAAEVEARAAWYVEVLPPGPERVPVRKFAELSVRGFGRLSHDFLEGMGDSFLGFSGRGTVLDGALNLSARWAGPWAAKPFQFLDFQALYVTDTLEMQAGRVGFSFDSLLSALGFWGLSARINLEDVGFGFGSGWDGRQGRAGGFLLFRPDWGEIGGAYREERGDAFHRQSGAVWMGLQAFEDLFFRAEAGGASVQGLTRFAGQMSLTWDIPDLFFLEARGYAIDPDFPAILRDRAGFLLSGRLGAGKAGFRFSCEWQRDNLRGLSSSARSWQGLQGGWDLFPEEWPLRFGFGLSLRRAADLSSPPALDERTARAEASAVFSQGGFTLGAQGAYTWFQEAISSQAWVRQEFREWLNLQFSSKVSFSGEFRQVRVSPPEGRLQGEAALSFSADEKIRLSLEYGRDGGIARAEFSLNFASSLTLKFTFAARWQEEGKPLLFRATLDFAHDFSWAPPFLPVFGILSGKVFADLNGNSELDPGEEGVPGAILVLDDVQVASGKDGSFRFPGRPPGDYTLRLARVPEGYGRVVPGLTVSLGLGKETQVFVPLVPLAGITGAVFLDLDGDGLRSQGERGLSRVYVRIVPTEGEAIEVLSDSQGRFAWPGLLPGEYRVELVLESLPPRHEPTSSTSLEVVLRPGEKKEVMFGARERPRPVVVVQPPLAEFTWSPSVPKAGESVLFDGTPSQAFGAEIVSYAWDFNDDGVVDAEGARITWTFPEPGLYLVTLSVTDSSGLAGRTQYLIQVRP
ncbi:MAG: PKD domain-containing protein [Candidatus Bipolaricaulaceae bacterium]